MAGQKISDKDWVPFLYEFNKKHRDKMVVIELRDERNKNHQVDKREAPLKEITINVQDKDNPIAQVIAGTSNEVSHFIEGTKQILYEQTDHGNPKSLRIDSSRGRSVLIQFENMG